MVKRLIISGLLVTAILSFQSAPRAWIRINLAGYKPEGMKVAVWGCKEKASIERFQLVEKRTGKVVYEKQAGKAYGAYGPFQQTYRLDFSAFKKPGTYTLRAGNTVSPEFRIAEDVYKGSADFALKYMRQQRSGYNPYLKDS